MKNECQLEFQTSDSKNKEQKLNSKISIDPFQLQSNFVFQNLVTTGEDSPKTLTTGRTEGLLSKRNKNLEEVSVNRRSSQKGKNLFAVENQKGLTINSGHFGESPSIIQAYRRGSQNVKNFTQQVNIIQTNFSHKRGLMKPSLESLRSAYLPGQLSRAGTQKSRIFLGIQSSSRQIEGAPSSVIRGSFCLHPSTIVFAQQETAALTEKQKQKEKTKKKIQDVLKGKSQAEILEKGLRHLRDAWFCRVSRNTFDKNHKMFGQIFKRLYELKWQESWIMFQKIFSYILLLQTFLEPQTLSQSFSDDTTAQYLYFQEMIILAFSVTDSLLTVLVSKQNSRNHYKRLVVSISQIGLSTIFCTDFIIFWHYRILQIRFSSMLRPLWVISYNQNMAKVLLSIFLSFHKVMDIILFFIFISLFWGYMGYNLFAEYKDQFEEDKYFCFGTFQESIIGMYTLISMDTYPLIMKSIVMDNSLYLIFFIPYVALNLFFFLFIPVAVIFENYKKQRSQIMIKDNQIIAKALTYCFFCISFQNNQDYITKNQFCTLLNLFYEGNGKIKNISELYNVLTIEKEDEMNLEEFLDLYDIMKSGERLYSNSNIYWSKLRQFCNKYLHFKEIGDSARWNYFILFIVLCNTCLVIISSTTFDALNNSSIDDAVTNIEYAFTVIYVSDVIIKLVGFGVHEYFQNPWNNFDFIMVLISLITIFGMKYIYFLKKAKSTKLVKLAKLQKVLKIFRSLRSLKLFKIIKLGADALLRVQKLIHIFILCIPSIYELLSTFTLFSFSYAIIGTYLFNTDYNSYNEGSPYEDNDYTDFNSIGNALLVLFQIMTQSKWVDFLYGYGYKFSLESSAIYFIFYHMLSAFFFLSLLQGMIWEVFSVVENYFKEQEEEEIHLHRLALANYQQQCGSEEDNFEIQMQSEFIESFDEPLAEPRMLDEEAKGSIIDCQNKQAHSHNSKQKSDCFTGPPSVTECSKIRRRVFSQHPHPLHKEYDNRFPTIKEEAEAKGGDELPSSLMTQIKTIEPDKLPNTLIDTVAKSERMEKQNSQQDSFIDSIHSNEIAEEHNQIAQLESFQQSKSFNFHPKQSELPKLQIQFSHEIKRISIDLSSESSLSRQTVLRNKIPIDDQNLFSFEPPYSGMTSPTGVFFLPESQQQSQQQEQQLNTPPSQQSQKKLEIKNTTSILSNIPVLPSPQQKCNLLTLPISPNLKKSTSNLKRAETSYVCEPSTPSEKNIKPIKIEGNKDQNINNYCKEQRLIDSYLVKRVQVIKYELDFVKELNNLENHFQLQDINQQQYEMVKKLKIERKNKVLNTFSISKQHALQKKTFLRRVNDNPALSQDSHKNINNNPCFNNKINYQNSPKNKDKQSLPQITTNQQNIDDNALRQQQQNHDKQEVATITLSEIDIISRLQRDNSNIKQKNCSSTSPIRNKRAIANQSQDRRADQFNNNNNNCVNKQQCQVQGLTSSNININISDSITDKINGVLSFLFNLITYSKSLDVYFIMNKFFLIEQSINQIIFQNILNKQQEQSPSHQFNYFKFIFFTSSPSLLSPSLPSPSLTNQTLSLSSSSTHFVILKKLQDEDNNNYNNQQIEIKSIPTTQTLYNSKIVNQQKSMCFFPSLFEQFQQQSNSNNLNNNSHLNCDSQIQKQLSDQIQFIQGQEFCLHDLTESTLELYTQAISSINNSHTNDEYQQQYQKHQTQMIMICSRIATQKKQKQQQIDKLKDEKFQRSNNQESIPIKRTKPQQIPEGIIIVSKSEQSSNSKSIQSVTKLINPSKNNKGNSSEKRILSSNSSLQLTNRKKQQKAQPISNLSREQENIAKIFSQLSHLLSQNSHYLNSIIQRMSGQISSRVPCYKL